MKNADYLIIGAGVIGSLSAYYLSERGERVTILDTCLSNSKASGSNAGTLDLLMLPGHLLPYAKEGVESWKYLQNEKKIDVGFHLNGAVYAALNDDERKLLEGQRKAFKENGLEVVSVSHDDIRQHFSYLSDSVVELNYSAGCGYLNPLIAGNNMLAAAQKLGAEFLPYHKVEIIQQRKAGLGYEVTTNQGVIQAKKILISAGMRSPRLLAQLGFELRMHHRVPLMTVTAQAPQFIPHIVCGVGLTLKQTAEGSVLIGGGWQGHGKLFKEKETLCAPHLYSNIHTAMRLVPGVGKLDVLRHWCCFEGNTEARLPIVQEIPNYKDAYVAVSGLAGITIGPAMGKMVADLMTIATGRSSRKMEGRIFSIAGV